MATNIDTYVRIGAGSHREQHREQHRERKHGRASTNSRCVFSRMPHSGKWPDRCALPYPCSGPQWSSMTEHGFLLRYKLPPKVAFACFHPPCNVGGFRNHRVLLALSIQEMVCSGRPAVCGVWCACRERCVVCGVRCVWCTVCGAHPGIDRPHDSHDVMVHPSSESLKNTPLPLLAEDRCGRSHGVMVPSSSVSSRQLYAGVSWTSVHLPDARRVSYNKHLI